MGPGVPIRFPTGNGGRTGELCHDMMNPEYMVLRETVPASRTDLCGPPLGGPSRAEPRRQRRVGAGAGRVRGECLVGTERPFGKMIKF